MNTKRISKFLSLVLRHKPEALPIELDKQGWADLDEIIEKMQRKGMEVDESIIQSVVANNDKQRFRLDLPNRRIRANQGHSINIDLALDPSVPPAVLFHGTATRFIDSIMEKGLIRGSRQHVHLSLDIVTATKVGSRHGKPTILAVDAQTMHQQGYKFFVSENGVWLTEHVPVDFLSRADRQ
ncbi:MAG: RNA 2'-phosphotransferase [Saprospiraceae bacterium]|nr:RNA 2'-phosphotransferase [Saprospiraceae bacterium]